MGPRIGMYTDDTNSTLALASSLVKNGGLFAEHTALEYSKFWIKKPKRGYPNSAQAVLMAVLNGHDYRKTGTNVFPDGSYANGGAMRISPIGIAFRNASNEELLEAVKQATLSSHVHPEAVDGSFLVAKAIAILCQKNASDLSPIEFLKQMKECALTEVMKKQIDILLETDFDLPPICDSQLVVRLGDLFQIRAVEAVPCALWVIQLHFSIQFLC